MSIIAFLFFFIIALVVVGLSIINSVLRTIFNIGRRPSAHRKASSPPRDEDINASDKAHRKIFNKDDGEYVDFEEIVEK